MEGRRPTLDTVFAILSNEYRRRLLYQLYESESGEHQEICPADLTDQADDVDVVTLELYNIHLPKLSDAGYVEWVEEDELVVGRGPEFKEVASLFESLVAREDELPADWLKYET